jgi:hypothetical protein
MGALYRLMSPSGRQYIGVTSWTVARRYAEHCRTARQGRGYALHSAIRKYGQDRFLVETLVIADDIDYLHELELKAIKTFGTLHPAGYNLTAGGEGILGLSERSKLKRSEALKGRPVSSEARAKISAAARLQMQRPGMRDTLRALATGRKRPSGLNARMSELYKQTHRTPEMRGRISAATKAAHERPEVKARVAANARAKWADPAARSAHSEKMRKKWADPEWKAAMLQARAGARAQRASAKKG